MKIEKILDKIHEKIILGQTLPFLPSPAPLPAP
jgi:hypothetical protein